VSQLAWWEKVLASIHFDLGERAGSLNASVANINQKYQYFILRKPDGRREAERP